MTIAVSNTELNDSFNTWRLNSNEVATIVSNNVVTVSRAGSADRHATSYGNGHIKGTFTANELRTSTLKGGNTSADGVISISSNTTVNATTLTISANTTFTGNVNFTSAGTDRIIMGDVSRIRVTGGSLGQFLRVAGSTDALDFKSLTLRDISDLSSNSSNIILSGSNTSFSDNGDSPALVFSSDTDRVEMYLAKDATAGDSDLYIKMVDTNGDSKFTITDSSNTAVCTIDSNGQANFSSNATAVGFTTSGNILPVSDDAVDLGAPNKEFRNAYIDGVANIDELSLGTAAGQGVSTSIIPKTDAVGNLGSSTRKWGTIWGDTTNGGAGVFSTLGVSGDITANGNVTLGSDSTDTITVKGNVANAYISGLGRIKELKVDNNVNITGNTTIGGVTNVDDTTQSTNTTTGAVIIDGGVGVAKNLNVGGNIHATGNITSDGDITLGNETADTITMKGNFANQHTEGTATFGGDVGIGTTVTTGYDVETANSVKINENLYTVGNTVIDGSLTVGGSFTVPNNAVFSTSQAEFVNLTVTGNTALGDTSADEIAATGTFVSSIVPKTGTQHSLGSASSKWNRIYANNVTVATNITASGNVSVTNNLDVNGNADVAGKIVNDGTTIIGSNGKLHANNTISAGTITGNMLADAGITIRDGAAGTTDVVQIGEVLQFTEGEGIDITISNNEVAIAGEEATTSNKGVASFNTNDFSVTSGAVSIKSGGVATSQIANTMTAGNTRGNTTQIPTIAVNKEGQVIGLSHANVASVSSLSYTASNNTIRVATADGGVHTDKIDNATASTKGVASFDSGDFTVTSGAVTLKDATTGAVLGINATANETTVSRSNGTVTVGLPDDVTVTSDLTVGGGVFVSGNLVVSGTTTTINTETINLADNIIVLNSNEAGTPSQNGGISIERGTSADKTLLWDETADKWTVGSETMVAGTFEGAVTGDVTGNADTATALATARTIGGVSFDGSANINLAGVNAAGNQNTSGNAATATKLAATKTIGMTGDVVWTSAGFDGSGNVTGTATIQPNSVALGTDTTGNYVGTITGGTGLTSTAATTGEGTTHSLSVDADQRSNITQIGVDTNDYYKINATTHDWYLDGVLDMRLENDGDLHCDGDVVAYSTTTASDIKLKENITPVENALDKVKQLTGVEFDWKKDGSRSAGVIAQDVEKVLPQAVNTVTGLNTDEEHKVVNYDSLHALLIEAVKELSAEIEILKGNK